MKRITTLAALLLALLICVSGISWGIDLHLGGRDIVTDTGTGGNPLAATGEDLLCGEMPDRYPWPAVATTITVHVASASDIGWVVVEGLNSAGDPQADSTLASGVGAYLVSGTWWRVNTARFRAAATNVGPINIRGADGSLLAQIGARQSRSCPDHYTLPADVHQLIPKSLRVTPVAVFSKAPSPGDSSAVGAVAVLGREYGGNWYKLDETLFDTDAGQVVFAYPPTQWDLGGRADVVVAGGLTEARTDIGYRLQFETR